MSLLPAGGKQRPETLSLVNMALPCKSSVGVHCVVECGVARYACRKTLVNSFHPLLSNAAVCKPSFKLRLKCSTSQFALGQYTDDVLCMIPLFCKNSLKLCKVNCTPLSEISSIGFPSLLDTVDKNYITAWVVGCETNAISGHLL